MGSLAKTIPLLNCPTDNIHSMVLWTLSCDDTKYVLLPAAYQLFHKILR